MKKNKNLILQVAIPSPLRKTFDYLAPSNLKEGLKVGVRVRVPFQKKEKIGVLCALSEKTDVPLNKLKSAIEILDEEPVLDSHLMTLCQWAADYYHHPIGDVIDTALPNLLRKGKPTEIKMKEIKTVATDTLPELVLSSEQATALAKIENSFNQFQVLLLEGITGSGKTEVYLQAILKCLAAGQQVLVLVPEIGLTPQTLQRFRKRFAVLIAELHSGLTDKQRLVGWLAAKAGQAKIIIGTRSAVFTPAANLGLIIVDEEHDVSFKQQEGFRYHARDLAIMRAQALNIPIVLGSATPALETLHRAKLGKYQHLHLRARAGGAVTPDFVIADIRKEYLDDGLSSNLLKHIGTHLQAGNQVMLFLNRRGYAPVFMCHACGWVATCKRCDARMTYHQEASRLHCHHCDKQLRLTNKCDSCHSAELHVVGVGTERLEHVLQKHFPKLSIARIDRDNTKKKGSLQKLLHEIQDGTHQIILGTQMLAKGHHFPNVTLVGIVDADTGFFSSDFRAVERMGQLILQVSGRSGRDTKPGSVVIQTHHPDHPLLSLLMQRGYSQFAERLMLERDQASLPPFSYFALFRAEAHKEQTAELFLQHVKALIDELQLPIPVFGPIPAPMSRRAGKFRHQLLLQAKQRPLLQRELKKLLPHVEKLKSKQQVRWSLDVDPIEMY